jgi:aspartate racemase
MKTEGSEKIVGILGGMGPESTAHLFLKIIKNTPAKKDQDHLRIIIYSNPKIPDRTLALLGEGENPLEEAKKTVYNLEKAGAEIIALPCNTMHYYYRELQNITKIPIIDMISETALFIHKKFPDMKKIGLLATTGTIKAGIYERKINGVQIVIPSKDAQKKVMNSIYGTHGIKAGYIGENLQSEILEITKTLIKEGAEAIVIGCTELSLLSIKKELSVPVIDPLEILAKVIVKKAMFDTSDIPQIFS